MILLCTKIMHHHTKQHKQLKYLGGQCIKLMSHRPYSPDFSLCDLWLFPKIKEELREKSFQDNNELDAAVQEQMESLRKEDFYQCFEHWFERMNKYISVQKNITLNKYNLIILI